MSSRIRGSFYRTSAWRLAVRSTLVFAIGSAGVFLAMYFVVARAIQARSDSWLIGESETLKQVALSTPRDALYDRIVEEVAELASQEVSYDDTGHHIQGNTVFFAKRTAVHALRYGSVQPTARNSFRLWKESVLGSRVPYRCGLRDGERHFGLLP